MSSKKGASGIFPAVCRIITRRKSSHRYVRLGGEANPGSMEPKAMRLAVGVKKVTIQPVRGGPVLKGKKAGKVAAKQAVLDYYDLPHPLKTRAKPELLRYLEYTKETGKWEPDSDRPVLYFD